MADVLEKVRGSGQGVELAAIMDINAIRAERRRRNGEPELRDMRLSDETVGDDAESISAEGEVLADLLIFAVTSTCSTSRMETRLRQTSSHRL